MKGRAAAREVDEPESSVAGRARRGPAHGTSAPGRDPGGDIEPRRARVVLALILAVALSVRVVYVLQSRANPFFDEPAMDALYHAEWARAFAAGREFQPGPFFRAPLYPWFLGVSFRVFGEDYLWPRLVQALIGTASCALVYAVGARAFDRRTGLLAALAASTYWILVYFDGELLSPVLEVFFGLAAILLTLRLAHDARGAAYLVAGLAWGLAAITRPNVLYTFVPLLVLWVLSGVAGNATERRTRVVLALFFTLGVALPILPISAYNRLVGGDTALIATNGGVNLWIGNNPSSDGTSAIVPGTRPDWWGGFEDSIRLAESEAGRDLRPSEVDDHYRRKALSWMLAEPVEAGRKLLLKLALFWKDWEIGNNQDERYFALRFGPILRTLPLGFAALASLGLVGFALAAARWRSLFPLWAFLPVYTASVVLFFVNSRYRVPVLPVLAIFGAFAVVDSLDAARARRWRRVALVSLAAALLAVFARTLPAGADRSDAYGLWQLGVYDAQHGDHAAAREKFEQAVALRPGRALFHKDLGIARLALGLRREAEASFLRAVELEPANADALEQLVRIAREDGRLDAAREALETLQARVPHHIGATYAHGLLAIEEARRLADGGGDAAATLAKRREALAAFDACLAAQPGPDLGFSCALGAGRVLLDLERPDEAIAQFERAVAARPEPDLEGWFWRAHYARLEALVATGRRESALRDADALIELFPDDPRAAEMRAEVGRIAAPK